MDGLFKSDTYEMFKNKKAGAELIKGKNQPNVFIKCSVDLSSELKEDDELTIKKTQKNNKNNKNNKILIDDVIKDFDTSKLDENLYVKNDLYLYFDKNNKVFGKANGKTKYYAGKFSYIVDKNKVNCIFVMFDENNGKHPVKNKLIGSVPSIKIEAAGNFKWYKPSDIQTISPELYNYIVKNI